MAYTAAGLCPDGSSSYFLPRRVGVMRAKELMITNRRLDAAEALDWGLVNQVVADAELMVFDASSHMPHLEEPEAYVRTLRGFLARI